MNLFERALEMGYDEINETLDTTLESFLEAYDNGDGTLDVDAFMEDFGDAPESTRIDILEAMTRHINAAGTITKKKSRAIRSRRAVSTTGMSKTALKLRARKAARSKKRNPAGLKMAKRRRAKAMRRRKSMGLDKG